MSPSSNEKSGTANNAVTALAGGSRTAGARKPRTKPSTRRAAIAKRASRLKSLGVPIAQVARIAGISRTAMVNADMLTKERVAEVHKRLDAWIRELSRV